VPSVQLKIKVNVVHVGLSQLLVLLKDFQPPKENFKTSLNNNSLTVQDHMETTTVTEVLWIMPSPTLEIMVSHSNLNTDIPPEKEPVKKTAETSRSSLQLPSQLVPHYKVPSHNTSFQSPLMPLTSNSTPVVSSIIVKPL